MICRVSLEFEEGGILNAVATAQVLAALASFDVAVRAGDRLHVDLTVDGADDAANAIARASTSVVAAVEHALGSATVVGAFARRL